MIISFRILLFLPALLAVSSCCPQTQLRMTLHGDSYRGWFAAQVMNPGAPDDPTPVMTLPGSVAMGIHEKRYIPAMTEKKEDEDGKMESQFGN